MIKYRLHNITNFGVEIHDFYTENSLNNYIAIFVDTPYWVENLETNEITYLGVTLNDNPNVSRETLYETPIEWIARHTSTDEKEPFTKQEKILYFLGFLSVIIMATFLLYLFLSSVSFIAEHFSDFTWKVFSIL
jgi:hypothetical protein